jgi:hypothetical protein
LPLDPNFQWDWFDSELVSPFGIQEGHRDVFQSWLECFLVNHREEKYLGSLAKILAAGSPSLIFLTGFNLTHCRIISNMMVGGALVLIEPTHA